MRKDILKHLAEEIETCFTDQLTHCHVRTWIDDGGGFHIKIGKRDLQLDKHGNFIGCGSDLR